MAGIGFELRGAVVREAGLIERVRAWTAAGLISSGPWLATVAVLVYLHAAAPYLATGAEYELFRGLVTYAFAFSLVTVGLFQMPVTRHLADQLWLGRHESVLPGYVALLASTGVLQATVAGWAAVALELTPAVALAAVALYVTCSWTWVSLVWLGAARDYGLVLRAYALGGGATVVASCIPVVVRTVDAELGALFEGVAGLLTVFTCGQAVTLLLLASAVARGVRPSDGRSAEVLASTYRRPRLLALGALYGVGMWADKFVFWAVDGVPLVGALRHHPLYDACSFLAYGTVVPALALHLVRTETGFYERYRDFYDAITCDGTLAEVRRAKERMLRTLRGSVVRLVRLQAWFTLGALLLAPEVLARLGMPTAAVPVFRVLAVGAYFHVMFLLTVLVLLYFDRQATALSAVAVFALANTVLPFCAAAGSPGVYGVGYALASLLGLSVGFAGLQRDLGRLEWLTFQRELQRS